MKNLWARVRAYVSDVLATVRDMEPAKLAERVRQALIAGNALGWWAIPDTRIAAAVSLVSALASFGLTRWVRSSVWSRATMDKVATGQHHPTEG
ncbi:hypothetical protein [Saccharothrix stipae]